MQVQITVPGRQTPPATVGQAIVVRGTVQNLPAGHKIWVFTQNPGGTALNPQPQAAVINSSGGWASQTFIGSGGDAGKQFQILAVTADTAAVNKITGYLARARQTGNYPGLPAIPAGARQYDKIPVIRQGTPPAPPPSGVAALTNTQAELPFGLTIKRASATDPLDATRSLASGPVPVLARGGHLWRGMSRADVKELGEVIDAGQAALVIVGESKLDRRWTRRC